MKHTYGLRDLLPFISRQKGIFHLTIASGVIAQFLAVATAATSAWIVGQAATGMPWSSMTSAIWLFLALVIATAISRWARTYFGHDFAFCLVEHIQMGLFDGLARAAPNRVLGRRTGEVASIATSDAEMLEAFFAHLLGDYVGAMIVPFAALLAMAWIDPVLALVLLPFLPLVASIPFWLAHRAGAQGEAMRHQFGMLNGEVVEGVMGLRELTAFGFEQTYVQRLMARTRQLQHYQFRYGSRIGLEAAAVHLLLATSVVAMLAAGWWSISQGRTPVDLLPLVIVLAGTALAPITQATVSARKLGELKSAANRVLSIFHQQAAVEDHSGSTLHIQEPDKAPAKGPIGITFDHVGFGYDQEQQRTLKDVCFHIAPGEMVALVGRSGAGKSTCINLLMRFWDPDAGSILVGDMPLKEISTSARHDLIALVPQDTYLFDLSVADNIRLGRPQAPQAEVERAARQAQAHHFIAQLPQGYDTHCGERGSRLSGGQRQRIAIARALLCDAPILLMDEAVSNLDTESEHALQHALAQARQQRTTLVIAHRLSTIRSADRILVLDEGEIVEQGTHDRLMKSEGLYKAIVAAAMNSQ